MDDQSKKERVFHNRVRLAVLTTVLILLTAFGLLHQYSDGWRPLGVDALCPFGGVESLITVLRSGKFIERIGLSSFILLAATALSAFVFRRAFCGYLCPLGTLQELSRRLGKKFLAKNYVLPDRIDRAARWIKYAVLAAAVVFSVLLGELVIRPYDPWVTWQHLFSAELFSEFTVGLIVLLVSLLGSAVYDRVFCKYLCPMGGLLGILGKAGYFRIKRNEKTCIDCSACTKACPVGIPVAALNEVKTAECISCNLCVAACPVKDTLQQTGPKGTKLAPKFMLLGVIGLFAAVVGATTITGDFPWAVKSIERHTAESGSFNPDDIKGSDSFEALSKLSGVSKAEFTEKFKLTDKEWHGTLKTWAHKPDSTFEVSHVREFLKEKMKK